MSDDPMKNAGRTNGCDWVRPESTTDGQWPLTPGDKSLALAAGYEAAALLHLRDEAAELRAENKRLQRDLTNALRAIGAIAKQNGGVLVLDDADLMHDYDLAFAAHPMEPHRTRVLSRLADDGVSFAVAEEAVS